MVEYDYRESAITFLDDKVQSIDPLKNGGKQKSDGHPKWAAFAQAALQTAVTIQYGQVCPQIYRKPVLFFSANDYQWLQACNANGYMLFGVYIYTGGK